MEASAQPSNAPNEPKRLLVRGLSLLDATMIVVGSMIGSGIFLVSAESARWVASPGWLLAAWALAGVLTITGALSCAELAAMMPRAGGQYVFLREAYGPSIGFLFGWTLFLVVQTGTIAAVAVAFANFMGVLIPAISGDNYLIAPRALGGYAIGLSTNQLIAILMILLLTATNLSGLKTGKIIQNTFTFTKTAALLGLIVVGLTIGWKVGMQNGSAAFTSSWWNPTLNGWSPQASQLGFAADWKSYPHACLADVSRPRDVRTSLRPVGLEQCHLHWRRSRKPGSQSTARTLDWMRTGSRIVFARQPGLRDRFAAGSNSERRTRIASAPPQCRRSSVRRERSSWQLRS